ncbi:MAG TPA: cation:proton antiporter [Burkholderiales bacterium]|nr:cation:proton antiporter [Burkholderiales bacterium]
MTSAELSVTFFLQMFFILALCRAVGRVVRRWGQPQVVGEMIAGVLMGPSLLGLLWPGTQPFLFPPESLNTLYVIAQLGIGLYMFLVGVEFNRELFRSRMRSAAAVSLAGMLVPFVVGAAIAFWLVEVPGLFSGRTRVFEAMLFLGAAMAITAFPVLARIIHDRGLTGTALGSLVLAAGAINDAAAWCVFAVVLASSGGGPAVAVKAFAGGIGYALLMIVAGRKLLAPLGRLAEAEQRVGAGLLGAVLILLMLAAWATDAAGIHAVFGGFLLGVAMPRGVLTRELKRQLEPFAVVFLLPVFFAFSGLKTRLDLVAGPELLLIAGVILIASIAAKGGACWAAARLAGEGAPTAMAVGILMNTRGVMELIILNIGLQKGIIQPALFSIMVLMAIVTTLMTTPLFEWVYGKKARAAGELDSVSSSA